LPLLAEQGLTSSDRYRGHVEKARGVIAWLEREAAPPLFSANDVTLYAIPRQNEPAPVSRGGTGTGSGRR
jgi:hypothetical protein